MNGIIMGIIWEWWLKWEEQHSDPTEPGIFLPELLLALSPLNNVVYVMICIYNVSMW